LSDLFEAGSALAWKDPSRKISSDLFGTYIYYFSFNKNQLLINRSECQISLSINNDHIYIIYKHSIINVE